MFDSRRVSGANPSAHQPCGQTTQAQETGELGRLEKHRGEKINLFRRASGASQVTLQSLLETTWLCLGRLEPQHPPGGESYDLEILSLVKMR